MNWTEVEYQEPDYDEDPPDEQDPPPANHVTNNFLANTTHLRDTHGSQFTNPSYECPDLVMFIQRVRVRTCAMFDQDTLWSCEAHVEIQTVRFFNSIIVYNNV